MAPGSESATGPTPSAATASSGCDWRTSTRPDHRPPQGQPPRAPGPDKRRLLAALAAYLREERPVDAPTEAAWVGFRRGAGRPLRYSAFEHALGTLAAEAGADVHAHMFRHTLAQILASGSGLAVAQRQLGHQAAMVEAIAAAEEQRRAQRSSSPPAETHAFPYDPRTITELDAWHARDGPTSMISEPAAYDLAHLREAPFDRAQLEARLAAAAAALSVSGEIRRRLPLAIEMIAGERVPSPAPPCRSAGRPSSRDAGRSFAPPRVAGPLRSSCNRFAFW